MEEPLLTKEEIDALLFGDEPPSTPAHDRPLNTDLLFDPVIFGIHTALQRALDDAIIQFVPVAEGHDWTEITGGRLAFAINFTGSFDRRLIIAFSAGHILRIINSLRHEVSTEDGRLIALLKQIVTDVSTNLSHTLNASVKGMFPSSADILNESAPVHYQTYGVTSNDLSFDLVVAFT